jgi:hypothetical protein
MHDAEGINFKVGLLKQPLTGKDSRRIPVSFGPKHDNPSLSDIDIFISRLNLDEDTKVKLKKIAMSLPHGSLGNFRTNYRNYLKRCG